MLVQRIITLIIIVAAAGYLVRSLTRKGGSHSEGGCSKCSHGGERKSEK
ncbi:MAG: FeoB-associated Cys-rich membrane protein [bacterium]